MPHKPRWLLFAAIVVVLALVGLAGVSVATVRRSFPQTDGEISLPGLNASVEVLRDSYGVAHIYADNADDLFEAQGYVHAQDRFFEMDVRRHITSGRLSELFGPSQVGTDTFIRTLGWRRVAQQELQLLSRQHPPLPGRVRRRGQRLPAVAPPGRHLAGVQPARAAGTRLHARAVDGGGLAGLVEGDGLGPGRQHGS